MRNILNISLPAETAKQIKREVKNGNFASTSEFMRYLIRLWNTQKLALELKKDQIGFKRGKYKILNSFKDLE